MGISESTDIPLFSNKNGIDIIVKFDKNGEVIWQQAYEYYDSGILLNQIYETSDNGFLLIGFQSGESIKTVIVKCDHNGNVYFEKKYDTRLKRFDDLGLSPTLNLKFGLIGGAPQIDLTGITNEYIETPVIKIIFESDDFKIMTNADKDPAETKVDNPKTNDNTLLNMIIGGISLTELATTGLYIKKKYN